MRWLSNKEILIWGGKAISNLHLIRNPFNSIQSSIIHFVPILWSGCVLFGYYYSRFFLTFFGLQGTNIFRFIYIYTYYYACLVLFFHLCLKTVLNQGHILRPDLQNIGPSSIAISYIILDSLSCYLFINYTYYV